MLRIGLSHQRNYGNNHSYSPFRHKKQYGSSTNSLRKRYQTYLCNRNQDDRNIKINNKENQNDEEDFSFNTLRISL